MRALIQCAYPEGTAGAWTSFVDPIANATLTVPPILSALDDLVVYRERRDEQQNQKHMRQERDDRARTSVLSRFRKPERR